MEVIVKVVEEDLVTATRNLCAISFLTFVAIDKNGHPIPVAQVVPQTEMEKTLNESAKERADARKKRRKDTQYIIDTIGSKLKWKE